MIRAENLSFSYGDRLVLSDLSFTLEDGVFYGIIGPNGSGKTTLLRLLTRLEHPLHGRLFLDNTPYPAFSPKELARRIALLPQGRELPVMTAEQLVACGRYPYEGFGGKLTHTDEQAILHGLERTQTLPLKDRPLSTLSGGERQRVYLAMLLAQDTPHLFLDEPTTYLDIGGQFQMMDLLATFTEKCVTAVLHDLPLALEYCQKILVLNHGVLAGFGTPAELVRQGVIDRTFGITCTPLPQGGYHIRRKQ